MPSSSSRRQISPPSRRRTALHGRRHAAQKGGGDPGSTELFARSEFRPIPSGWAGIEAHPKQGLMAWSLEAWSSRWCWRAEFLLSASTRPKSPALPGIHEKFGAEENLPDEKADEILASLSITGFSRFTKAKLLLKHIFKYWDLLSIASEEKMKFSYIFCFVDCAQHDEVTEPNALGLNVLQEMEDELAKLKDACNTKTANKVKQLDAYVQLSHLDIEKFPCTPANANIDPSARLNEIRNVIRSVKSLVSKRSAIVTMTEFVLNAVQEVRWFRKYDECDDAIADVTHPFHARTIKAERLSCTIEGLLNSLKPKVLAWEATENEPFMFDKDKLLEMIKGLESEFKKEHPPRSARTPDVEFPVPLRVVPLAADEVVGNADSRSLHVSLAADEVDGHADSRSLHVSPAADKVDGHAASRSLHVSPAAEEVDGHAASRSLHVSPAADEVDGHAASRSLHVSPAADEVDGHADSRSLHVSPAAEEVDGHAASRSLHVSPAAVVAESSPLSVSPYSPEVAEGAASSPSSYMSSPYQSDPNDSDYVP